MTQTLDLHGLTIKCSAESEDLLANLLRPFKLFRSETGNPAVRINIVEAPPPYADFPSLTASFSTPRNVVYDSKTQKIIDYFGRGAVVEDKEGSNFTLYGDDPNFLQEAFYLMVMSIFGQYCDRGRLMRLHALAVSYGDRAFLLPMTPGLGKSTMALALLKEEGFRLISDDEPVISADGQVLPFNIRIGTLDDDFARSLPPEYVYTIDRMEFGPKHFIDIDYWADRLEHRALDDIVFVTSRRVLNAQPSIESVPKRAILNSLLRDAVIGVGLYQGLEFMLSHSPWSTVAQSATVYRRARTASKLYRNCRTFRMTTSTDVAENVRVFCKFVRQMD